MKLSRRRAIQLASMSAIATAAGTAFAAGASSQNSGVFSNENLILYENISAAVFQPWVGTVFTISGPSGAGGKLTLKAVANLSALAPPAANTSSRTKVPGTRVTGFTLTFQGTGKALPQTTYTLTHPGLGSFSVFLVPSGGKGQPTYTAVFTFAPQKT